MDPKGRRYACVARPPHPRPRTEPKLGTMDTWLWPREVPSQWLRQNQNTEPHPDWSSPGCPSSCA